MIQIKEVLSNFHPGLTTHLGQTPGKISHIRVGLSCDGGHDRGHSSGMVGSYLFCVRVQQVSRYLSSHRVRMCRVTTCQGRFPWDGCPNQIQHQSYQCGRFPLAFVQGESLVRDGGSRESPLFDTIYRFVLYYIIACLNSSHSLVYFQS